MSLHFYYYELEVAASEKKTHIGYCDDHINSYGDLMCSLQKPTKVEVEVEIASQFPKYVMPRNFKLACDEPLGH